LKQKVTSKKFKKIVQLNYSLEKMGSYQLEVIS